MGSLCLQMITLGVGDKCSVIFDCDILLLLVVVNQVLLVAGVANNSSSFGFDSSSLLSILFLFQSGQAEGYLVSIRVGLLINPSVSNILCLITCC
jgi:hypothetical protein